MLDVLGDFRRDASEECPVQSQSSIMDVHPAVVPLDSSSGDIDRYFCDLRECVDMWDSVSDRATRRALSLSELKRKPAPSAMGIFDADGHSCPATTTIWYG